MNVRRAHGIAILLLLVFITELTLSVRRQSLSWDEGDHIFAGYQSWKVADFGINPEHPPLVKELATLPLLAMHLKTPAPAGMGFFKDEAYTDGRGLIYDNGGLAVANTIIFRVRMFAAVLSLLMVVFVYLAGLEMFGPVAAVFAMSLVVFEPNLIAHGAYVTTDMGITCFMFATIFALFRFRERPSWKTLLLLGLATGLALASKHSAVLLLPIVLALGVCELIAPGLRNGRAERRAHIVRQYAIAFAGAASIGLFILWATYGFRFSAHPNGIGMTPSLAEYIRPLHGIEPKIYLLLARMRILPESYLYGLADIRLLSVAGQSFPTYLFNKVHAHGVPYYFPAAFVVKSTLGFMLLLVLAGYAVLTGRMENDAERGSLGAENRKEHIPEAEARVLSEAVVPGLKSRPIPGRIFQQPLQGRRRLIFLIVPPTLYLIIAMFTGLNIGARHILPMYPFLAVLIGGAVVSLVNARRVWMYVVVALLAWHAVSSIRSAPVYLAYSNEAWGGPSQTYRYLTDSNVDWGQQLISVKEYVDRNGIKDCWFGYFVEPWIDFHAYGIPCRPLPTADSGWAHVQIDTPPSISGVVFISASVLTGYEFGSALESPYQSFQNAKPVATIDRGVYVYNGTFDTRFAAALGDVTRGAALFDRKDFAGALTAAQNAVATDPDVLPAQSLLGDTLAALHRDQESAAAYDKALAIAARMEPDAKADRQHALQAKKHALHL